MAAGAEAEAEAEAEDDDDEKEEEGVRKEGGKRSVMQRPGQRARTSPRSMRSSHSHSLLTALLLLLLLVVLALVRVVLSTAEEPLAASVNLGTTPRRSTCRTSARASAALSFWKMPPGMPSTTDW
jgi:hypothetical protein